VAIDRFRYISRNFLGLITQERKSLLLCALCSNDFGRLSPEKTLFTVVIWRE